MPNPTGANQLYTPEPAYGDVKRQAELTRSAPLSGAPVSGRALNAPRRARQQRSAPQGQPQPGPPPPPQVPMDVNYDVAIATVWREIATDPQASDEVRMYAAEANGG